MARGHDADLETSARRLTTTVSGGADAATAARRALRPLAPLLGALHDDVALLVSELVTNAVRHAGVGPKDPIALRVAAWPRRVRVEVSDRGSFSGREPRPRSDGASGWGLYLVDRLADRWGAAGGTVWFELGR